MSQFQDHHGQKFCEITMLRLIDGIERLSAAIEKQNGLMEKSSSPKTPPPDSLKPLMDAFMSTDSESSVPDIARGLRRWRSTYAHLDMKPAEIDDLYHKVMNKLPSMVAEVCNGEVGALEPAEEFVRKWNQETAILEIGGEASRMLVRVISGFILDEIENTERAGE
jgi:hypothetical protein